ncbi:hypothetical protein V8E36_004834 [Tilletia maclaganii]
MDSGDPRDLMLSRVAEGRLRRPDACRCDRSAAMSSQHRWDEGVAARWDERGTRWSEWGVWWMLGSLGLQTLTCAGAAGLSLRCACMLARWRYLWDRPFTHICTDAVLCGLVWMGWSGWGVCWVLFHQVFF